MDDTHPDARDVQIDLLRRAGPRRRAALASRLTNGALQRARRGISRAHPELSKLERDLLFVEVHYGREIAARLQRWMESRRQGE